MADTMNEPGQPPIYRIKPKEGQGTACVPCIGSDGTKGLEARRITLVMVQPTPGGGALINIKAADPAEPGAQEGELACVLMLDADIVAQLSGLLTKAVGQRVAFQHGVDAQ